MSLKDKIVDMINEVIVFLKGEEDNPNEPLRPLYTNEELKEMYSIKKDIEKFPKHSGE